MDPVDGKSEGQEACKLESNRTPARAQMQVSTSAAADFTGSRAWEQVHYETDSGEDE